MKSFNFYHFLIVAIPFLAIESIWKAVDAASNGQSLPTDCEAASTLIDNAIRVASCNFHAVKDFAQLGQFINALDPTILILKSVPQDDMATLQQDLSNLKLKYYQQHISRDRMVDIAIASKLPLTLVERGYLDSIDGFLAVSITINRREIGLFAVCLGGTTEGWLEMQPKVEAFIKDKFPRGNYILFGDFRIAREYQAIQAPTAPQPHTINSEIFIGNGIEMDVLSPHPFEFLKEEHAPIIIDIKAPGASKAIADAAQADEPFRMSSRLCFLY